ncbi:3-hydroxyacyl-CoA dehydrogenase family protein [Reinekea thalattae]|uniref:3-hydroxybutyryl-CoA dehydrogenase n=1 Tax=Reinekea thalattae TaxID=2593301 RepID=A0A5C8Z262_9GAMM|nr:3-hydroxyacyl-CoA dehydrogenase NAD-binding domain-containing protein [Reinekea thalattae]TXR51339.1 3-hydroxybutyryl-CoA dehydrogenase [Reinekea thalattae]
MTIATIGVIGAGTMGAGIAQVFAQNGFEVHLVDNQPSHLQRAVSDIQQGLEKALAAKRISAEQASTAAEKLHTSTQLEVFKACDLILEAVSEEEPTKIALFQSIDRICPEHTILASNTSAIAITRMAAATKRPDRFMGMHFMKPAAERDVVELIRALQTSDETYQALLALSEQINKTPVEVKDYPGFVSNRLLIPMINEAAYALYEGVASAEDIDTVMELGRGHQVGPLRLADSIGLDICLSVMNVLHSGFQDSKYRPCPLLQQMVDAGYLGEKTGRGFYTY